MNDPGVTIDFDSTPPEGATGYVGLAGYGDRSSSSVEPRSLLITHRVAAVQGVAARGQRSRKSMPVSTPEEFVALVRRSRLLSSEPLKQLQTYAANSSRKLTPVKLAQWLVQNNQITVWQAERLLAGVSSFFLGNYKFLHPVAEGAMGVVFKAQHAVMGRIVAIKVLSKARLSHPNAVARFAREVQAVAALDHPNIVTAYDAGQIGHTHYLVMEYIDGIDLSQFADRYRLVPLPWACEFVRQAALGLHHAHKQGMVHRDIKPANILVCWREADQRPVAKVLDLGLALIFNEVAEPAVASGDWEAGGDETDFTVGSSHLTQAGTILGTPDYLAPEQITRNREVDARSDIFGLGCTLFRLITGQLPYSGPDLLGKLHARVSTAAPPAVRLRTLLPEASPELDAILARMLERDPELRPQTALEVAELLAPFAKPPKEKWDDLRPRSLSDEETGEIGSSQMMFDPQLRDFLGKLETDEVASSAATAEEFPQPRRFEHESSGSLRVLPLGRRRRSRGWVFLALLLIVGMSIALWQVLQLDANQFGGWPGAARSLSFAWASRYPERDGLLARSDFQPMQLVPRGNVAFHDDRTLAFAGPGEMVAAEAGRQLVAACHETGAFTLEVWITPLDLEQQGPACIARIAPRPADPNVAIAQEQSQLVLYLRTDDARAARRVPLTSLLTIPQHVLVTYRSGELRCFVNGRSVFGSSQIRGGLEQWEQAPLFFGSEQPGHAWQGWLQGITVRSNFTPPDDVRMVYLLSKSWLQNAGPRRNGH